MSTITNAIVTALSSVNGISQVIYDTAYGLNVRTDFGMDAIGMLIAVTDRNIESGLVKETASCNVIIGRRVDFEQSADAIEPTVVSMMGLAESFLSNLTAGGVVELPEKIQVKTIYDYNDTNLAGVSIQFDATEMQGHCMGESTPSTLTIRNNGTVDVRRYAEVKVDVQKFVSVSASCSANGDMTLVAAYSNGSAGVTRCWAIVDGAEYDMQYDGHAWRCEESVVLPVGEYAASFRMQAGGLTYYGADITFEV